MRDHEILNVFERHRPQMLRHVFKNNHLVYGITKTDLEEVVNELPIKVLRSKAKFSTESQLLRYLYVAVDANIKDLYDERSTVRLSDIERLENYSLARDIINKNRSGKINPIYSSIPKDQTTVEEIVFSYLKTLTPETIFNPINEEPIMAKEDFCFTYYDGDAARDKAHMNRLERGAYDDLISAQRKRGHLSISDIKKVIGSDFDTCWESMEWILKKDEEGKYFIEWVDTSLKKSKDHSEKQKKRIQDYWDKKNNTEIPRNNHGMCLEEPLEDEDGDVNGILIDKRYLKEIVKEEKKEIVQPATLWTEILEQWQNDFNWEQKFCKDEKISRVELNEARVEFLKMIENTSDFKQLKELKAHFYHWRKKNYKPKSGFTVASTAPPLRSAHEIN